MREAVAARVRSTPEGAPRCMKPAEERCGENPMHIAYYLCYPSMVKRTVEEERPGPWEQRF